MPNGHEVFSQVIGRGGLGVHIPAAQVDALSADLFTSTYWLRNANWGTNQLLSQETVIYRPDAATLADYVRYASDLSASQGAVVPDSSWDDVDKTNEDFFLLKNGVHPQFVIDGMNRGLGVCYTENSEPLSLAQDAGFQSSSTSAWTESDADSGPATTFTKIDTLGSLDIFSGLRSGRAQNAASGGYIRQRFYVHPGEQLYLGALSRASVGTAALVLWDVTSSAQIGSTIIHGGQQWGFLHSRYSVPSGCHEVEVRLQGQESTADIFWNALWVQRVTDNRVMLSSTWDTEFKVPSLAMARFAGNVAAGVERAFSIDPVEINAGTYGFQFERPGAHPSLVQFHGADGGMPVGPIYIQGRRAFSDFTEFEADLSQETTCDLDLLEGASRVQCFLDPRIASKIADAETRLADSYGAFLGARGQFKMDGPARRQERFTYPKLVN